MLFNFGSVLATADTTFAGCVSVLLLLIVVFATVYSIKLNKKPGIPCRVTAHLLCQAGEKPTDEERVARAKYYCKALGFEDFPPKESQSSS